MSVAVAPGFIDLQYLFAHKVDDVGWRVIYDAIQQTASIHSQLLNEMLLGFAEPIDPAKPQYKFRMPVSLEMQPLDGEDDSPVPQRGFDEYDLAFPILDVGLAWGDNRKSRAKMTVRLANDNTVNAIQADSRWQRRQMFSALFYPSSYTFADPDFGSLTVKPLANGDTDEYHRTTGEKATDNHYLAQANAIDASNYPFDDISDELTEHPDNGGEVVVYTAKNLASSITALSDFIPLQQNRRIQPGISSDILTDFPAVQFGDRKLGWVEDGDCYIVRWDALPDNYMVAMMTGNSEKVLGYRDEAESSLQGVRPEMNSADGNHRVTRLLRTRGFAVKNRTAAVVYRIGDAAYAAPTGYTVQPNP